VPTIVIDGLRISYRREGTGAPLVLLHGFIVDGRVWRRQIDDLSRNFDVIAWDAPGCGESEDPREDYTMGEFAEALAGLLDRVGVSAVHILGLSWGGTLALEFYRQHPERALSLILADAYAGWTGSLGAEAAEQRLARCLKESELPPEAWVPQWAPEACSPNAPQAVIDEQAAIMSDFHPAGFRAMSRALSGDFRDILATIRVPTLLIWGADDSRSPVRVGEAMCAAIPGAQLKIIAGAGHVSNMEKPSEFNSAVRSFCRSAQTQGV
jgi:pimeloyl-ACP methyl ester carboxylesterase